MKVKIEPSWATVLKDEFQKPYFANLTEKVRKAYSDGTVFPQGSKIFRAFDSCPFDKVKVVILGQDPYHGYGQAEGLAFSVPSGIDTPPSLRNILQEIEHDLGSPSIIQGGSLLPWVKQGVLLLNSVLTVAEGKPASHRGIGWETFTDAALKALALQKEHVVFMLWGAYAQQKRILIPTTSHLILTAPHPSPLSAHRGFFGCRHFSQANLYLRQHGYSPINW